MNIGIVGGGLGGLTAAISLLQAGFDVHVYEQAHELAEVGAGIQVSPNASRVLHGLGLADDLARLGVRPLAWQQRRWDDGRELLRTPLGDAVVETFGSPHYQMHRADLQSVLVDALPPERVHVGHRFIGLRDLGDRVEATFENGERIEVDVLVGADGIHSSVRGVAVRPGHPALHGLRGVPRADPGRAARRPRPRGHVAGLDGPGQALRALLRAEPPRQLRRDRRTGHVDARVLDGPR